VNPGATVGAASILTALATALFACGAACLGLWLHQPRLVAAARRALMATALFTTAAAVTLGVGLLRDDFSMAYVASVSSREMQTVMKWASFYSKQPGSLLFWTWSMSLFMALFAWRTLPRIPWGSAQATALCGASLAVFLTALAFFASPFHVSEVTPPDGVGLNPLLVDRGMLVHPPFLLSGLVSTSIPFVLGMTALWSGRLDGAWLRSVRTWALASWLILSVGNFLGGWWAYTVLGWGGYWGWDPVENSAVLPLFPMTAFVHSMMVQERRGMLKLWNLALVVAAWGLAVFGTFNVRSGLVDSVHSFAQSNVGAYFLVVLAVTLVLALGLMAWRAPFLRAEHDFESLASRESSMIVNNYLFTALTLVVLGGTLFPVFSELFVDSKITVGPPFYNRVAGPLLALTIALIAVGTVLPWRRASNATIARRFAAPLGGALLAAVMLFALGLRHAWGLVTVASAVAVVVATLREYALGARGAHAAGLAWVSTASWLFARDQRRYGGYLVHLGVAVMAVAVVGSSVYQQQERVSVEPGETFEAGGRTISYEGLFQREGHENGIETEVFARLVVERHDGSVEAVLEPGRRRFANFPEQPTAVVALHTTPADDLYVFVQGWDESGRADFHVFVNPLIVWLWIGGAIYVVGGIFAWMPLVGAAPQRTAAAERGALAQA